MSAGPTLPRVTRVATTHIPTRHADFIAHAYREEDTGTEHMALTLGDLCDDAGGPALVRLHSECLTGDALGSRRCDCGEQLDAALAAIATEGRGAVVYLRGHEGRGIGLSDKLPCLRIAGRGPRHARCQPRARAATRRPRLQRRGGDTGPPRCWHCSAPVVEPGQGDGAPGIGDGCLP